MRAWLIATALAVTLTSAAPAAVVNATLNSVSPGVDLVVHESTISNNNINTRAGVFNWTLNSGTGLPQHFHTFCIELAQTINFNSPTNFNLSSNVAGAASPGTGVGTGVGTSGAMGNLKADRLRELFAEHYFDVDDAVSAAAFQLAIWEITHDGVPAVGQNYAANALSTGDFKYVGAQGNNATNAANAAAAFTLASQWLQGLDGQGPMDPNLLVLTNKKSQDQITTTTVPVPAGAALALSAFASLGLARLRRRKG